jgi:PKD repeat protein
MKPLKSLLLTLFTLASVLSANAADTATSKQASTATSAEITKAAKVTGIDVAKLKAVAKRDKDLRISNISGGAFYACRRDTSKIANPADPESFTTATLFPFTKTFLLHSRPGSAKVIYLDFKGHTTKGSYWNTDRRGITIVTPAFDIDGKPGTFNYAEHAIIQKIWKEVSDAYAVFDVDVTTQDPGVENIRKTATGDSNYGVRVCLGGKVSYLPNWQEIVTNADDLFGITPEIGCFSKQVSQVAYANDAPVLVFTDMLYQRGSAKDIADTTVHELGHAFGLTHSTLSDGTEYYPGHNDWAPYMGDTMGKSVGQWTNGDYDANATNNEDELAIIATYAPYVYDPNGADDHGNDINSATTLTPTKVKSTVRSTLPVYLYTSSITGMINSRADKDFFKIEVGAGEFYIEADAADPQPNLNIQIKLYDANGVEVVNPDPYGYPYESELGMSDSYHHYDLPGGTYYIEVDGVGAYWDEATASFINEYHDPVDSANDIPADCSYDSTTGTITNSQFQAFTDYASIGRYTLKTTGWGTPNNLPPIASTDGTIQTGRVAPSTIKFVGSSSYDPDGVITNYLWDFGDGTNSTLVSPTHVYSTPGTYTATLLVTDNSNATGIATTAPFTVRAVSDVKAVNVLSVSVAWVKSTLTSGYFVATIKVGDQNEKAVSNAAVSVSCSGLVSGSATAVTNAQGIVTIKSPTVSSTATGTETFIVDLVTLNNYPYDSSKNTVSSGSLTR